MTSNNVQSSTIPLCYPNNFHWNRNKNELELKSGESRDHVILNPDALEIIKSIHEPIAILGVVGAARSGKSYILSELQNGVAFELGHTMMSHTTGIWMARTPMSMKLSDGTNVRVILLDTEGIGAATTMDDQANDKFDNQIFTFSALVSSLLVYNSQSVPNAGDLEKLNFIASLCDSIHSTADGEPDIESISTFRKFSPDFFWLLRDVLLLPTDRDGNECDIKTYLQQNVLGTLYDHTSVKDKKNKVRQNIREMFTSFDAYALPIPAMSRKVIQNMEKPENKAKINPEFLDGVQDVKIKLFKTLKPKRIQGANSLTGKAIVQLMKTYNQALNKDGSVPDWANLWDTTIKNTFNEALKSSVQVYRKAIGKINSLFPCEVEELNKHHEVCVKLATDYFMKETRLNSDVELMQTYLNLLLEECAAFDKITHECTGGVYHTMVTENERISAEYCTKLMDELRLKHFESVVKNITSETSFEQLLHGIEETIKQYEAKAKGPERKEIKERAILLMRERLKQANSELKKMKDYDDQINTEIQNGLKLEAECVRKEAEKKKLLDDIEVSKRQHEEIMGVMKEVQKRNEIENERIANEFREDKLRMENDMKNLNEENKERMIALSKASEAHQQKQEEMQNEYYKRMRELQEKANEDMRKQNEENGEKLRLAIEQRPIYRSGGGCFIL